MNKYKNLKLENQLCFAVYAATNSITRAYRESLAKSDLTYTQYLIMLALWEKDKIHVKSIAEKLKVDSASIVPALKRMEIKGYIKREGHFDNDKRTVCIVLTTSGRELQHAISGIQTSVFLKTGLNDELTGQLKNYLTTLTQHLDLKLSEGNIN